MNQWEETIAKLRSILAEDPLMPDEKYKAILRRIYELGG